MKKEENIEKNLKPNTKKLFSEEQSQTILKRIKFLRIKKLFDMIDTEKCGYIKKESVCNFQSDANVMKILKPIFEEIINKNTNISLIEFEEKMDVLLTRISTNERMILLDVKLSNF